MKPYYLFGYRLVNVHEIQFRKYCIFVFIQMSMNVQVLHQMSVIPTLCVPILKDHTFVAVVGVTKETVEIAQVFTLLCIKNSFIIGSRHSYPLRVSPDFHKILVMCT